MARSVLVVDDEPNVRYTLSACLRSQHFDVHEARDGLEALSLLQTVRPALVILDVLMPGMNGFEVLKRVKGNPAFSSTPIIMLTTKSEPTSLGEGIDLGADFYLPKPFSIENLLQFINLTLNGQS